MKNFKSNHYIDTTIYLVETILKNLKTELRKKIDELGIGITSEQFVVLDTICCEGNMYQEKLSSILMKDKSNMTRILKILVQKDLITKSPQKINNKLVYKLDITDEGKKLLNENIPKIKEYITDIFKNVSDKEIDTLHSISNKIQNELYKVETSHL